jgi:hypothetical protein
LHQSDAAWQLLRLSLAILNWHTEALLFRPNGFIADTPYSGHAARPNPAKLLQNPIAKRQPIGDQIASNRIWRG